MISSLYRYPKSRRREVARAWGKRSGIARQRLRDIHGVDADTLRCRALDDARGEIIREGATYRASGVTHWRVVRSLRGRTNQFDFIANGRVKLTAGRRRFPVRIRP